ncbi:hypothetical protein B5P41_32180, partial [Bacillus sp. SRB_28]
AARGRTAEPDLSQLCARRGRQPRAGPGAGHGAAERAGPGRRRPAAGRARAARRRGAALGAARVLRRLHAQHRRAVCLQRPGAGAAGRHLERPRGLPAARPVAARRGAGRHAGADPRAGP